MNTPAMTRLSGLLLALAACSADGTGPDVRTPGTDVNGADDSMIASGCNGLAACGACTATPGCGWCAASAHCLSGTTAGDDDGTCSGASWDPTGATCTPDAGGCVATGSEDTSARCADGVDNDCNGYTDCNDFACSRTASVTVCADGGAAPDAGGGAIGPMGGTVGRLHFAAFGDARPPTENATAGYPTAVVTSVMAGLAAEHAQFAVASGDYMFANNASAVAAQLDLLQAAERHFGAQIFHAMGNHECDGADASNCPLGTEYANVAAFHARLASAYPTLYYDWTVHTSMGDAHFVATAPNAWSSAQASWLTRTLAVAARYTFVIAHEPPDAMVRPTGSAAIEAAIAARTGGVTLRLYGHTHEYRRYVPNGLVDGNAGAPLAHPGDPYGFAMIDQRSDGNIVVTAYNVGTPPTVADSWVVTPGGAATH